PTIEVADDRTGAADAVLVHRDPALGRAVVGVPVEAPELRLSLGCDRDLHSERHVRMRAVLLHAPLHARQAAGLPALHDIRQPVAIEVDDDRGLREWKDLLGVLWCLEESLARPH